MEVTSSVDVVSTCREQRRQRSTSTEATGLVSILSLYEESESVEEVDEALEYWVVAGRVVVGMANIRDDINDRGSSESSESQGAVVVLVDGVSVVGKRQSEGSCDDWFRGPKCASFGYCCCCCVGRGKATNKAKLLYV